MQQAAVDCGNDGEEGDFVSGGGTSGIYEWSGEAAPHSIWIEGEHELDSRAGKEWCEKGIDGAVDVVQRQDMQEAV
jgi:hypothetical protein